MLETLKLRANLIESSCLIFTNCFLPCMIIVFFHVCGLMWSIYFLQSRRGSQEWQFLFLSRGVSHGQKRGVLLDLCQLFPSMHDYCFLPCMWPQVIDLFPLKQAGIAGMTVSFSIASGIAWPKGRSLASSLPIVFFHAWLLFSFMHVASGDRFVSFKAGGDRRDDSFFFYRAGYCMAGREESCLIFTNYFLPCMIIVSFHACGLMRSICFLQSRRGPQGW